MYRCSTKCAGRLFASARQREIDERVYCLYDLAPDEIKIVEDTQ